MAARASPALDLNIAKCRLCVAAPRISTTPRRSRRAGASRVATKYVNAAREHFAGKGYPCGPDQAIRLDGSSPLVGLADAIVDLVSTGSTLKANNLVEVEDIMPSAPPRRQSGLPQAEARAHPAGAEGPQEPSGNEWNRSAACRPPTRASSALDALL